MKLAIVVVVAASLTVAALAGPAGEMFSTKYDNVDVDKILESERLLNNYFKCVVNKGPCTPDAEYLKDAIPDALTNNCGKCSEKQKVEVGKTVKFLKEKKPDMWTELKALYDPKGIYEKTYEAKYKDKLN